MMITNTIPSYNTLLQKQTKLAPRERGCCETRKKTGSHALRGNPLRYIPYISKVCIPTQRVGTSRGEFCDNLETLGARNARLNTGFTLLEMLLALVIFTLLSLAGWQILGTVTKARDVQAEHELRLGELDYAFLLMKQDFRQFVDRGPRVDGKVSSRSLFSEEGMLDSDDQAIAFVRAGWQNTGYRLPRSNLQRVYYRLKDNHLERAYDRVLDKAMDDEPEFRTLLSGVEALKFQFYYKGKWRDTIKKKKLPEAVAIQLTLTREGEIERRFILPSSWSASDADV